MNNPGTDISRRGFLHSTGVLGFAVLSSGVIQVLYGSAAAQENDQIPLNAWVSVMRSGDVIIKVAATEMGQGVMTSLPMILAEELDADWSKVQIKQVSQGPLKVYGNPRIAGLLFTAGSTSVEGYFEKMRHAGAQARRVLIHTAAANWGVPVSRLTSEPGMIVNRVSGQRMSFGEVVALGGIVTAVPEIKEADFKPRSEYRLIGTNQDRRDIPDKTNGATTYSIDVSVPGMVYASVLLAPVEGETPVNVEDTAARAVPGVIDVLVVRNTVAIVAERWETALRARDLVEVEWTKKSPFRSADSEVERAANVEAAADLERPATVWTERGDAPAAFAAAGDRVIASEYVTDLTYHAQMEPLATVVSVDDDGRGAEIWLGTQSQTFAINAAVRALDTTPDRIRFRAMQMGGGFGRRTFFVRDILEDALVISRQIKRPVKLMWTREDDVKNGWFRPLTAHKFHAVLDERGGVSAMRHRIASPSILQFVNPPLFANRKNRDVLIMGGTDSADYDIPDLVSEHIVTERQSRVSAWRAVGWGSHCYARECFIDELAAAANSDPASFRRRLLVNSARGRAVLDAVIEMSSFGKPPAGRAHGISFAGYNGTRGAGVAEVSIDAGSGQIRVHRFWAAVDPGIAIHPQNLIAQVEGGVLYGLSGLLKESITIVGGEVQQNNFDDYEPLRIHEVPEVAVKIVESGATPSGAGEVGLPMTGAAVANAVFSLTGKRLREMPFTPERVKAALSSQ